MAGKEMVDANKRLHMCKLAAKVDNRIKVFNYEIANKMAGETFNLFKRLLNDDLYKDTHNFSMIIGMDNVLSFDKWVNFEELERMVRFVVVPRKGYTANWAKHNYWFLQPPHIYLRGEKGPMDISSTLIRLAIEEGEKLIIEKGLHPTVYNFIQNNNLYGYL